jgi:spore coat protein U-like protein
VVPLLVRLGPGLNGATAANRRMARAGLPVDYLSYGLYRDVGRTSPWGNTDNVDTVSQTLRIPNNESRSADFTIYGRVPAAQDVSAGAYSDSVQLTVLY